MRKKYTSRKFSQQKNYITKKVYNINVYNKKVLSNNLFNKHVYRLYNKKVCKKDFSKKTCLPQRLSHKIRQNVIQHNMCVSNTTCV